MLNLSDKDLDRLSQEAAQQHEPGDIIGPRFWEKLESRLDRDLGKVTPNPARGIRRLPYYFAPALLVILGITYFLVRPNNKTNNGSPPLTLNTPTPANPSKPAISSPNPVSSDKSNSTSTEPSKTAHYPATAAAPPGTPGAAASVKAPTVSSSPSTSSSSSTSSSTSPTLTIAPTPNLSPAGSRYHHHKRIGTLASSMKTSGYPAATEPPAESPTGYPASDKPPAGSAAAPGTTATRSPRDLTLSAVRGPVRLTHRGSIDDSALRAFTQSSIRQPIRKGGLHINRSLEIGVRGGPDFASVNSIAGDRPGSTFGLTVDYQFANHWYIGSGLLFTRKIFAAAPQDYHVPADYYQQSGMSMGGAPTVNYIKGRFDMLEIPLNLRYDFSTAGSTLFFVSAGTSSYLFTNENCHYYYNFYNRPLTKGYTYTSDPNNLFSTLNLSMGAEAGISNSLSLLIAPYVKIPTRNIGFGQVSLSSVGIDFALRFAPVISRKR
jgi:hypothetical protein